MATVTLARNAVVAKLIDPPKEVSQFVLSLLSYEVEGNGIGFAGKSSFYQAWTNSFPAGFKHIVEQELARIGHTVHVVQRPHALPLGPENPIIDAFGNDDPRYDFQMQALRQVEKHGNGIIRVATGGGKSKIAKLIMARYRRMTLFLTTRGILMYQMDDQLKAIGMNTGQIGYGESRLVRGVNLGMVQTFVKVLEEPDINAEIRAVVKSIHSGKGKNADMPREEIVTLAKKRFEKKAARRSAMIQLLSMIEVVIGEEAHEAGGDSYFKILQHCRNATIRVALTATPFMRDSAVDNMRLMAAFGPILIDVSEELLINRGILAKPYFKFVDAKAPDKLRKSSPFERAYTLGYTENDYMQADMIRDAHMAKSYGLQVLTLVTRIEHGERLLKAYLAAGLDFEYLRGEDDQDGRKATLRRLGRGEIDGVIGTTIVDVGVDVPAISLVQLAGGMKAEVSLRQRIGRGLRAKPAGVENVTFVIDYSCNLNNSLRDHARQRYNIIANTPGFAEGILPANQDLPWHLLEKVKAA